MHTGRTHQIRVHLAHIGHPVVGSGLWQGRDNLGLERQALHASPVKFYPSCYGQGLTFVSPLPPDIRAALTKLRTGSE